MIRCFICPFGRVRYRIESLNRCSNISGAVTVDIEDAPKVWPIYADGEVDRLLGPGGDSRSIRPIAAGFIALHEMPKDLLKHGSSEERAARIAQHDRTREMHKEMPRFGKEHLSRDMVEETASGLGTDLSDRERSS